MTDQQGQQADNLLSGIRVLEVAAYIFAPGAATVMSDFGAEIIKIEPPETGDPYRYLYRVPPMPACELNYCWILDSRNKKSVALDLATEAGREILRKLIESVDVLITNYRPSVLSRLELRYEDVKSLNSRLIYAQVSGYGERGEEVEKPGYDMTAFWARSGLMDAVANADGDPALSMAGMGDHPSSMGLFGAIMMALYQREKTGRGMKVSTSLMAGGAWANSCLIQAALCGAEPYVKRTRLTTVNPLINHYVSRDGKRFIFCCLNQAKDWGRLCGAIEREDLVDDLRFATQDARREHAAELVSLIDEAVSRKDMAQWREILARNELTWSPVPTIEEVSDDPQMLANDVFVPLDDPKLGHLKVVSSPIFVEGVEKVRPKLAPEIGQHTIEILESAGYSQTEIDDLIERGVVAKFDT